MSNVYKCPFCFYSFNRSSAIPEEINHDITVYHCPNPAIDDFERKVCEKELPLNFFDTESKVISICGSHNVGKTYYLIALLHQLKYNKSFHGLGFSSQLIGDKETVAEINKKVDDINDGKVLPYSIMRTGVEKQALVIDLAISTKRTTTHIYLSFFDTPGEGYTDRDYMYRNFQCIYKADGLLFLVEPLQIKYLIDEVHHTNDYLKNQRPGDLHEVFYNVIDLLKYVQKNKRNVQAPIAQPVNVPEAGENDPAPDEEPIRVQTAQNIQEEDETPNNGIWSRVFGTVKTAVNSDKVKVPIAIGLTKADQIQHLLMNEIPYDNTDFETIYLKDGKIDMEQIRDISGELKELAFNEMSGEVAVGKLLNGGVEQYELFGIKSGDVSETGIINDMSAPQGVLMPLIWLLIKLKLY